MTFSLREILNGVAFILTVLLVLYGLQKGYDLVELFVYNLYFIVMIATQFMNIFDF